MVMTSMNQFEGAGIPRRFISQHSTWLAMDCLLVARGLEPRNGSFHPDTYLSYGVERSVSSHPPTVHPKACSVWHGPPRPKWATP